ncbi:MAG: glycosyltransferase family 2 protein [Actinomycetota bacterium]
MIRFSPAADPEVTVVMVMYGRWDWVQRTLAALAEHTDAKIDVIVVDNPHPKQADTGDRLASDVGGVTLVRNETNMGFAAAANIGARRARTPFLCFLNPDVLVTPGWLDPLVRRLKGPAVAATTPLLLDLDGLVQDAGSLLGRDGRTVALGRGGSPDDPAYRFARDVDYGTGACLLVDRARFEEVGGFDESYYPAYAEDVDLCLRFAQAGLRTVYEPASAVQHAGGVTSSPDEIEEMVTRSTDFLRSRWSWNLNRRPYLDDWEHRFNRAIAARDAEALDRFLIVLDRVPEPGDAGQQVASFLRSRWPRARVTIAAAEAIDRDGWATDDLLAEGIEVAADPGEAWFADRTFHFTTVITDADGEGRFDDLLERTQPQAGKLSLDDLASSDEAAITRLAETGVAPVRVSPTQPAPRAEAASP